MVVTPAAVATAPYKSASMNVFVFAGGLTDLCKALQRGEVR